VLLLIDKHTYERSKRAGSKKLILKLFPGIENFFRYSFTIIENELKIIERLDPQICTFQMKHKRVTKTDLHSSFSLSFSKNVQSSNTAHAALKNKTDLAINCQSHFSQRKCTRNAVPRLIEEMQTAKSSSCINHFFNYSSCWLFGIKL
jgi:hypothetical protein